MIENKETFTRDEVLNLLQEQEEQFKLILEDHKPGCLDLTWFQIWAGVVVLLTGTFIMTLLATSVIN
jgi:hypothetical protein